MVHLSKTADIFLSQTQIAVLSTVGTDNRPHSVPIWYEWDGDHAFMFTGANTLKWKNLSNNPYASLCVDFREPPYRSVVVRGKVKEIKKPLHDFVRKWRFDITDQMREVNLLSHIRMTKRVW